MLTYVAKWRPEVIVVGSHGRRCAERFLRGSETLLAAAGDLLDFCGRWTVCVDDAAVALQRSLAGIESAGFLTLKRPEGTMTQGVAL
jgi:hypothetical protein